MEGFWEGGEETVGAWGRAAGEVERGEVVAGVRVEGRALGAAWVMGRAAVLSCTHTRRLAHTVTRILPVPCTCLGLSLQTGMPCTAA